MTAPLSCTDAIEGLRAMLAGTAEPGPDVVAHWRSCPRCAAVLQKALQGLEALEATPDLPEPDEAMVAAIQEEARIQNRRRNLALAGLGLLVILAFCALLLIAAIIPELAILLGAILLPLSLVVIYLRIGRRPQSWNLYRRLGKGRQLGGVCLGLAERTGTRASHWRLAAVVAFLLGMPAFQLYVLMLILMPVHPDDREFLLRFQLRRWWARHHGRPEPHPAGR